MQIEVLFFGITRDIIGKNKMNLNVVEDTTVAMLKLELATKYPELKHYSYSVAINETYAKNSAILTNNDTIALIPPVSGG